MYRNICSQFLSTFRHRFLAGSFAVGLILTSPCWAAPAFPLTDSAPGSEPFRERFLASYGVNAEIEPRFQPEDRVLYERILPFLTEDPQRAIAEVEKALGNEENAAFRFLLGNLNYDLGNFAQAETELKRAIEAFPDFRRAHRTLGLLHIRNERYPEAIATWLKVITLGGGDAQSYGLLGYAYLSEKKHQSALSAYRMARMFKPDSIDFRRGEALALMATGEFNQAAALFDELIAEQPTVADHWMQQGNLYLQNERYEDAIANFEVVHDLGAGNVATRFVLGDLHLRTENERLALLHYRAAVDHPQFSEQDVSRALQALRHLIARELLSEARSYLDVLRPALPTTLEDRDRDSLVFAEARLAVDTGETSKAFTFLQQLIERNPLHADGLILLAELYQQNNDFAQAEFYLERALSIAERKPDALVALGRLEVSRGNWKTALVHLRNAEHLRPSPSLRRYVESVEAAARRP